MKTRAGPQRTGGGSTSTSNWTLQRKCSRCSRSSTKAEETCEKCSRKGKRIQPKLRIGDSRDSYEIEADRAADLVVSESATRPGGDSRDLRPVSPAAAATLRRAPANDAGDAEGGEAPSLVDRAVSSTGRPLEQADRAFMEYQFGYNFGHVRIHTDAIAAESARSVQAFAYTAGPNIVFDSGQFAPRSPQGRRLLAHELAHVVQQDRGGARVQRWASCVEANVFAQDCPPRESGEEQKSKVGLVFFNQFNDWEQGRTGTLIANFGIGKSSIDGGLQKNFYWKEFLRAMKRDKMHYELVGFSDCHESGGAGLRQKRAQAVRDALPPELRSQITSVGAAPDGQCMTGNVISADRAMNRSVAMVLTLSTFDFSEGGEDFEDEVIVGKTPNDRLNDCKAGAKVKTFPFRTTRFGGAPIMAHRSGDKIIVKLPMHVMSNSDFKNEVKTLPSSFFTSGGELDPLEIVRVRHYELPHWYNFNITGDASDDKKTEYCVTGEQMLKFAEATDTAFAVNFVTTGVEAVTLGTPVGKAIGTGLTKLTAPVGKFAQNVAVAGALGLREAAPTAFAGTAGRATATFVEEKAVGQVVSRAIAPAIAPVAETAVPNVVAATAVPRIAGTATSTIFGTSTATGAAHIGGGVVQGRVAGSEVFTELSNELAMAPTSAVQGGIASAVTDAEAAGLIGARGAPGTVDMAFQPHSTASIVRGAFGVSGRQFQSAHVGPTSFLRGVAGYSRGQADTVILDVATHRAFDASWKAWAIAQRQAGQTTCTVLDLRLAMHRAIDQIPLMSTQSRNTLAWRLEMEIQELGLADSMVIPLPYANIRSLVTP